MDIGQGGCEGCEGVGAPPGARMGGAADGPWGGDSPLNPLENIELTQRRTACEDQQQGPPSASNKQYQPGMDGRVQVVMSGELSELVSYPVSRM